MLARVNLHLHFILFAALIPLSFRYDMLEDGLSRYDRDGINSLVYEKKSIEKKKLYTLISVGIDRDLVVSSRLIQLISHFYQLVALTIFFTCYLV